MIFFIIIIIIIIIKKLLLLLSLLLQITEWFLARSQHRQWKKYALFGCQCV